MKLRIGYAALATFALALGLLAPAAVNAAPQVEKPSGQALVRIEGGTAYAKKRDKREYRIVVPAGVDISWMGEVSGKGTRTGTFTPDSLVNGWNRLGFREGARALTTLTWMTAGEDRRNVRGVTVWSPRINADGQLTFLTKVTGGPLPMEMANFSINIARAETRMRIQSRSSYFTLSFPAYPIDSTFGMQATVTNDSSVSVAFPASSGPANPCRSPIKITVSPYIDYFSGFPCGDGNVNDTDGIGHSNDVIFVAAQNMANGLGQTDIDITFTPTKGKSFTVSALIAQWDKYGNNKMP